LTVPADEVPSQLSNNILYYFIVSASYKELKITDRHIFGSEIFCSIRKYHATIPDGKLPTNQKIEEEEEKKISGQT